MFDNSFIVLIVVSTIKLSQYLNPGTGSTDSLGPWWRHFIQTTHIVRSLLARRRYIRQTPSRSNCDAKNPNIEICELIYNTRHYNNVYKQLYFYLDFPVILIRNSALNVNLIYVVANGCVCDVTAITNTAKVMLYFRPTTIRRFFRVINCQWNQSISSRPKSTRRRQILV